MRKLPSGWYLLIWVILGFLLLLSGVISENVVTMIVGTVVTFAFTSAFLTQYVKSERRLKKALEVLSLLITFGVLVYGFAITRSFLLGFITFFIVSMILLAFTASWLLPRIRGKTKALI